MVSCCNGHVVFEATIKGFEITNGKMRIPNGLKEQEYLFNEKVQEIVLNSN
jgi:hypothetical protein